MKRKFIWLLMSCLVPVSLVLASCAAGMLPADQSAPLPDDDYYSPPAEYEEYESSGNDTESSADNGNGSPDRMVVREGYLEMVVEDVLQAIESITQLTENMDGYVVSYRSWQEDQRIRGIITTRVPAERFDDAIKSLGDMAVEVLSQTTLSEDVTEEYVDLGSRLQNLEATEEQLLLIMEKAETIEEILAVQRELTQTREEIELIQGRMQYLERTTETSLIQVQLEQSKLDLELTASQRLVQAGEAIRFEAYVVGIFAPYTYEWDFGDGETSTSERPRHSYQSPGNYTITLTVTDDRGTTATETREDYITVSSGWSPGSVAATASDGLMFFGRGWATFFIWLGVFSPVWLIIGFLLYWFWWRRRKKKNA